MSVPESLRQDADYLERKVAEVRGDESVKIAWANAEDIARDLRGAMKLLSEQSGLDKRRFYTTGSGDVVDVGEIAAIERGNCYLGNHGWPLDYAEILCVLKSGRYINLVEEIEMHKLHSG